MPQDSQQPYYDDVVALVRQTLTRLTDANRVASNDSTVPPSEAETVGIPDGLPTGVQRPANGWIPMRAGTNTHASDEQQNAFPPTHLGAGFELVDITHLGTFLLISFHWREGGENVHESDETFVHVVDLSSFAQRELAPGMAEVIITTNLLERLGPSWRAGASLQRVQGLVFIS